MFTINGTQIKNPTGFQIERYTLTKSTRVANGNMVMEFVANKRKFNLTYAHIESTYLNEIIELLWEQLATTKNCFATFSYPDTGVQKEAKVYAGSIPSDLHKGMGKIWVWKDVQFSLIER